MPYRWCIVKGCRNNTIKKPEKLFVSVPTKPEIRKIWLKVSRRNANEIAATSCVYICEDHFEMEKDMANYQMYKMGFSKKILMVENAVPSKFNWLDDHDDNHISIQKDQPPEYSFCLSDQVVEDKVRCDNNEVKIENFDVVEQFIDDDEVHNPDGLMVKMESCDNHSDLLTGNFGDLDENRGAFSVKIETYDNDRDLSEQIDDQADKSVQLSDQDVDKVKIERLDIVEQFIDGDKVHIRNASIGNFGHPGENLVKMESYSDLSEQINDKTVPPSSNHKNEDKEENEEHISDKDNDRTNIEQQKCNLCEFSSENRFHFKIHVEIAHQNSKQFQCPSCNSVFGSKSHLKSHLDSVHLKLRNHKCHLCDFAATKKASLKKHIDRIHLNLKEHKCELCEYGSNRKFDLKKHIESVHLNLKQHKCHLCEFSSNHKAGLNKHVESVHLNLKQHECQWCEYATSRKFDLKKHVDSVHLNLKQHKCHLCEYASNSSRNLKLHIYSFHVKFRERK